VGYTNIEQVLKKIMNKNVTCVCFFGGSPEPHFNFSLNLCEQIIREKEGICRICWEWNGGGNAELVKRAAEYSLKSGGTIKFDLKFFSPPLAKAILGVPVERTYENFKLVSEMIQQRPKVPLLTATTLLVSYYTDAFEVEQISKFIAEINPNIPYSILIFHPHFYLSDLPITPVEQVKSCYMTAKKYLKNVHVGNLHLIGNIDFH
jgi:pyruvate formate lyase activating enzyme